MTSKSKDQKTLRMGCLGIVAVLLIIILCIFIFQTENYSNGERIGFLTKFSSKGRIWKSWEGELNLTQTGMNTSSLFDFSIDNDKEDAALINQIDSAVTNGWKVKMRYHEVFGKNWFNNRGDTKYFITKLEVLDKNPVVIGGDNSPNRQGRIIDTIFVVIDKSQLQKK